MPEVLAGDSLCAEEVHPAQVVTEKANAGDFALTVTRLPPSFT